jgi:hypothetical protein
LGRIHYILRYSLASTLSRKLKLRSLPKVFARFGRELIILNKDKTKPLASFPDVSLAKPNKFSQRPNYNPFRRLEQLSHITFRTIEALGAPCKICGSTNKVEMHHVRKLCSTTEAIKKDFLTEMVSKMSRKQIPLCNVCHKNLNAHHKNKTT